ncbi:MAG: Ig-like domain-containing protein, partial [Rhodobacteraceae bacterium]|nr:Ig-like domain-containing protein [Paracoccaceae bacterium]
VEQLSYAPDADFTGTDSFDYTVSDGAGGSATATVTVSVTPVNDAPVAEGDNGSGAEDGGAILIDVLANDSDIDGGALQILGAGTPGNGTVAIVTVDGVEQLSYAPDADFTGTDSFDYTVSDGAGGSATATVTVSVTPVNDAPVAADDAVTTAEDTSFNLSVLLENDSDVEDAELTIHAVDTSEIWGTVFEDEATGNLIYRASRNDVLVESFEYTVIDSGGLTDTATATVTVTAVQDQPVANDDAVSTDEDTLLQGDVFADNGSGVDFDVDIHDELSVSEVNGVAASVGSQITLTSGALLTLDADGKFDYDPNGFFETLVAGESGTDSFAYTLSDGQGGSAEATVSVTIDGVNDAPEARDDFAATTEDGGAILIDVLGNDTDVDHATLDILEVGSAGDGVVSIVEVEGSDSPQLSYTPDADFTGTDSFVYTVSDGAGGTATGEVTVTVAPVNDAPVIDSDASDTSATAQTNDSGGVRLSTLSGDVTELRDVFFSGAEADDSTFAGLAIDSTTGKAYESTGYGQSENNEVRVFASVDDFRSGVVESTLMLEESTDLQATYFAAQDGKLFGAVGSDPGFGPQLGAWDAQTGVSTGTVFPFFGLQVDAFQPVFADAQETPMAVFDDNGTLYLLARADDAFVLSSFDPVGFTESFITSFALTPQGFGFVADGRIYFGDSVTGTVEAAYEIASDTLLTGLDIAFAPPGVEIGWTSAVYDAASDALFLATPERGEGGERLFVVDDALDALTEDHITATGVVRFDDADVGDTHTAEVAPPAEAQNAGVMTLGPVTEAEGGGHQVAWTYRVSASDRVPLPEAASFADSFVVTLRDSDGATDSETVTVTVVGINDAPVAEDDAVTAAEDSEGVSITPLDNDFDPDGDELWISSFDASGLIGDLSFETTSVGGDEPLPDIISDTTLIYTPAANFEGEESFTYTVTDGDLETTATVVITVVGANDAPVFDLEQSLTEGNAFVDAQPQLRGSTLSVTPLAVRGLDPVAGAAESHVGFAGIAVDAVTGKVYESTGFGFDVAADLRVYASVSDFEAGTVESTLVLAGDADIDGTHFAVRDGLIYAKSSASDTAEGGPGLVFGVWSAADGSLQETDDSFGFDYQRNVFDRDGEPSELVIVSDADGIYMLVRDELGLRVFSHDSEQGTVLLNEQALDIQRQIGFAFAIDGLIFFGDDEFGDIHQAFDTTTGTLGEGGEIELIGSLGGANGPAWTAAAHDPTTDALYLISSRAAEAGEGGTDRIYKITDAARKFFEPAAEGFLVFDDPDLGDIVTASVSDAPESENLGSLVVGIPIRLGEEHDLNWFYDIAPEVYRPLQTFNSFTDVFTVTVDDGNGGTDTIDVSIYVEGENDPPDAVDDVVNVNEGGSVEFNPIANDSDVDGDPVVLSFFATDGLQGNLTDAESDDGNLLFYEPAPGFFGVESTTYEAIDLVDFSWAEATITFVVNARPEAVADTATTAEDNAVLIDVLDNDTDNEDHTFEIVGFTQAQNGFVRLDASTGQMRYAPDRNFFGEDSFTYTIRDELGAEETGTVTVTVTPVADDPIANADFGTVLVGNESVTIDALANDVSPDGLSLSYGPVQNGAHGSVQIVAGNLVYTPDAEYSGVDSFTYTVNDTGGGSHVGTVTVLVQQDESAFSETVLPTLTFNTGGGGGGETPGVPVGAVAVDLSTTAVSGGVNLGFVLDASGSIGSSNWLTVREAVVTAIVGTEGTPGLAADFQNAGAPLDINVIGYSTDVFFNEVGSTDPVSEAIQTTTSLANNVANMPYPAGWTDWNEALTAATEFFSDTESGLISETDVNVLYFVTDGNPVVLSVEQQPFVAGGWGNLANALGTDQDVEIRAFSIGSGVTESNLLILDDTYTSSGPDSRALSTAEDLADAFRNDPLFNAELVEFSLFLRRGSDNIGEIADETDFAEIESGLNFAFPLTNVPGLANLLGDQNVFTANATFELNGTPETTDDQLIVTSQGEISKQQTSQNVAGTGGGDLLLGSDLADTISGGGGDDVILGFLGSDSLSGGAGDDVLGTRSSTAQALDGGDGRDVLNLLYSAVLDTADLVALNISNIEALDMTNDRGNDLTLTTDDVLDMSGNGDVNLDALLATIGDLDGVDSGRTFTILGDTQDSVSLIPLVNQEVSLFSESGSGNTSFTDQGGTTYQIYQFSATVADGPIAAGQILATLAIDDDIAVNMAVVA